MARFDVAVVGSGFAGSILARLLNRRGLRVVLLEKGRHPRFALGESTTPLANFALERLAASYDLPDLHHLSTWGRWRRGLPHLRRGLKRGFTFYRHRPGEGYRSSAENEARLLVAASPEDRIADTHWLRADVDHHLVTRAAEEGVDYRDATEVTTVEVSSSGVRLALRSADGGEASGTVDADFVVDASGPAGVVARSLGIPAAERRIAPETDLLYGHFEGAGSFVDLAVAGGATVEPGPYPDERAAVHHLLEEGWAYLLHFDDGVTSAGILLRRSAGTGDVAVAPAADPAGAWDAILARYPTLEAQFRGARPTRPIRFAGPVGRRLDRAAGRRWFLLPHVVAFFDPLFSTGIAWSLLAVERLALLLEGRWGNPDGYDRLLRHEADQVERLIAAAYRAMAEPADFDLFTAVSRLYFVTVSYHEARQRLIDPAAGAAPYAWEGFLGAGSRIHRDLFRQVLERLERLPPAASADAAEERAAFLRWLGESLAAFDVAGLDDPDRRNLHPVDLEVLVERAHLLGLTRGEVRAALPRLRGEPEGGEEW